MVTVKIGIVREDADPFPLGSLVCMNPEFSFLSFLFRFIPLPFPSAMAMSRGMSRMVSLFASFPKLSVGGFDLIGVRMISSFVSNGWHSLSELNAGPLDKQKKKLPDFRITKIGFLWVSRPFFIHTWDK